jgi:hypothetical protein
MRFKLRQVNTKLLTVFILCFTSVVFAEDFKMVAGKEYKNVTVSRIEPDGITVTDGKSLVVKLPFTELPKDVQERFGYDPKKDFDYRKKRNDETERQNRIQALQARHEELEKQEDDLLLTIGEAEVGTYGGYPNPLRSQLPYLHSHLDEVRREKDQVKKEWEKAQREKQ